MLPAISPTKDKSRLELLVEALGVDEVLKAFSEEEWNKVLYDWEWNSRLGQVAPPGDWMLWLIRSGRGWGKTRVGAETIRGWAEAGEPYPMYIIGATSDDVRSVMIEGESGILAKSPWWFMPDYEPSKRRLTWPNGVVAYTRSADKPDRLRGPQGSKAWLDEFCAWRYAQEAWDQINMMIRLGDPRMVMTTTPRPTRVFREILAEPDTVVQRGTTMDNLRNLSDKFMKRVYRKYEGTRLGRQELGGEVLDDNPGALWAFANIEADRVKNLPVDLLSAGAGVDPSGSDNPEADEVGIITAGKAMCRCKGFPELHAFVYGDSTDHYTPDGWAQATAKAYKDNKLDRVIAEKNFGGDMVESNLRTLGDTNMSIHAVTASRGKKIRAVPVAALYEQHKVHHVGAFPKLEDELTQWNPNTDKRSPNRLDALVWVLTWLMLGDQEPQFAKPTTPARRRW